MKSFYELNADERLELKQTYLASKHESISWGELANADELISDEELENEYGYILFSDDDFCCNVQS